MRLFVAAFVLATVVPARAHHPFTPYYDASKLVSVTGVVVELRDVNPHVVLIVDGTTTDGRSGLWAFEGLPPNAFQYRGLKDFREKLRTGTRMTISGWAAKRSVHSHSCCSSFENEYEYCMLSMSHRAPG